MLFATEQTNPISGDHLIMPNRPKIEPEESVPQAAPSDIGRMLKIAIGSVSYLAGLSFIVAADDLYPAGAPEWLKLVLVLVAAAIVLGVTYFWTKSIGMLNTNSEPIAPSARKSQITLWVAAAFGLVISVALILFGDPLEGGANVFSNGPLPTFVSLLAALLYVGITIVGGYRWHRTVDEHERSASNKGAIAAIYAYAVITPVWWLGERASILPTQEPMIVFVAVIAIYSAVWTYFRGE